MIINVTAELFLYRELLRLCWNAHVSRDRELVHYGFFFDRIEEVRRALLRLVFSPVIEGDALTWQDLSDLHLLAKATGITVEYLENEPNNWCRASGFPDGAVFRVRSLYDLGNMALWDLRYIKASVVESADASLVGRQVLLEARFVDEIWVEQPGNDELAASSG